MHCDVQALQSACWASAAHLLVLVQGVDDELHHPVDLGLEDVLLRFLPDFLDPCSVQAVQLDGFFLPVGQQREKFVNNRITFTTT